MPGAGGKRGGAPEDQYIRYLKKRQKLLLKAARELGILVMAFADLEDETTAAINQMLRINPREGWILESLMQNFSSRILLFRALAELNAKDARIRSVAKTITDRLQEANSDRNHLVHDAWDVQPLTLASVRLGKIRFKVTNDGDLKSIPTLYDLTPQLLRDVAEFFQRITRLVQWWRGCLGHQADQRLWPAPLPSKYYEHSPLHTHAHDQKKSKNSPPRRSSRQ